MAKQRVTTAIRFTEETHRKLAIAADERDVSMNFLVEKAVEYYLERLVPADEIVWVKDQPKKPVFRTLEEPNVLRG